MPTPLENITPRLDTKDSHVDWTKAGCVKDVRDSLPDGSSVNAQVASSYTSQAILDNLYAEAVQKASKSRPPAIETASPTMALSFGEKLGERIGEKNSKSPHGGQGGVCFSERNSVNEVVRYSAIHHSRESANIFSPNAARAQRHIDCSD